MSQMTTRQVKKSHCDPFLRFILLITSSIITKGQDESDDHTSGKEESL